MEIFEENNKLCSVHFESVLELLDYEGGKNERNFSGFKEKLNDRNDTRWYGGDSRTAKQVIDKALLGDPKMLASLRKKVSILTEEVGVNTTDYIQRVQTVKRKRVTGAFGDEIDIHKVYQGQANEAWRSMIREEVDAEHHLVTLLVDICENSNVGAEESLWRAAATYKLVSDLEGAGKSVKVLVGSASTNTYERCNKILTTSVVVKEYGQQLPYERLAAMTHLGFFRTFCFAAFYAQDKYSLTDGYGRATTIKENIMPLQLKPEIDAGHTKYVVVGRARNLGGAVISLESAYKQMKNFS